MKRQNPRLEGRGFAVFRGRFKSPATSMLVLLSDDRQSHAVIKFPSTLENPSGFHRLIGGSVELGETSLQAFKREIREEFGATVVHPELLGVVENIFTLDKEPGHEIVFIFGSRLAGGEVIPPEGGMFSDNDEPMWVEWRLIDDAETAIPLFPESSAALAAEYALSLSQAEKHP
ncbi:NUDIX domain-containing protein [Glaciihabitans sp. UYNi722]|uniref:NUDIX domain-containing protein n=1 Tax=Glaciihabitans sp. UYNi722 TaxID=3156344 RepID=UPI003399B09C